MSSVETVTIGKSDGFSLSSVPSVLPLTVVLSPGEKDEGIFRPGFSLSYFGRLIASVLELAQM